MGEPVTEPKKDSFFATVVKFLVKDPREHNVPTVEQAVAKKLEGPVDSGLKALRDAINMSVSTPTLTDFVHVKIQGVENVSKACGELTPSVAKGIRECNAAEILKGR